MKNLFLNALKFEIQNLLSKMRWMNQKKTIKKIKSRKKIKRWSTGKYWFVFGLNY